jgi:Putative zinc-finger
MTCSDVERILPDVIDGADEDLEFRDHLKSCPHCSELVADLKLIASEARDLVETDDPPARVWIRISNQLRAEGLIREPKPVSLQRPVQVPAGSPGWRAWWLVPVAAAIFAAGSYQLTHRTISPVAQSPAPRSAQQTPAPAVSAPVIQAKVSPRPAVPSSIQPSRPVLDQFAVRPEPSEPPSKDDEQFLTEVSQRAPGMRSTYENQLQAVNAEIRETQRYIKAHPEDLDARQYLMETYQQKAMLYQMALDHIQ